MLQKILFIDGGYNFIKDKMELLNMTNKNEPRGLDTKLSQNVNHHSETQAFNHFNW